MNNSHACVDLIPLASATPLMVSLSLTRHCIKARSAFHSQHLSFSLHRPSYPQPPPKHPSCCWPPQTSLHPLSFDWAAELWWICPSSASGALSQFLPNKRTNDSPAAFVLNEKTYTYFVLPVSPLNRLRPRGTVLSSTDLFINLLKVQFQVTSRGNVCYVHSTVKSGCNTNDKVLPAALTYIW